MQRLINIRPSEILDPRSSAIEEIYRNHEKAPLERSDLGSPLAFRSHDPLPPTPRNDLNERLASDMNPAVTPVYIPAKSSGLHLEVRIQRKGKEQNQIG
jgi:hypothetical protein